MKLLMCMSCGDIFNLDVGRVKSCTCGKVRGKYLEDGSSAVVNGQGHSLAMGTGSIMSAIGASVLGASDEDWRNKPGDIWRRHDTSIICWARPHTGPGNSHTTVNPDL